MSNPPTLPDPTRAAGTPCRLSVDLFDRCLSADGRSWMKGPGVTTQTPSLDAKETGGWAGSRAEAPRVVSVGWWSDKTVGALSSTGELAFLDAAAEGGGLSDGLRARFVLLMIRIFTASRMCTPEVSKVPVSVFFL